MIMIYLWLVGVNKMVLSSGVSETHGELIGEKMVISELSEVLII